MPTHAPESWSTPPVVCTAGQCNSRWMKNGPLPSSKAEKVDAGQSPKMSRLPSTCAAVAVRGCVLPDNKITDGKASVRAAALSQGGLPIMVNRGWMPISPDRRFCQKSLLPPVIIIDGI
jgi:hypothetical protein